MRAPVLALAALAVLATLAASCAISDNDAIANIGAPCVVADGQCDVEHVCTPSSPGSANGLCAPVKSFGAACDAKKPVLHPAGQIAKDKDASLIDIRTTDDLGFIDEVRTVKGTVETFDQGASKVDIPDLCNFRDLQEVGNGLGIGDTAQVATLDGLQSVTAVKGGLAIFDNASLTDVGALANVSLITPRDYGGRSVDVVIADNQQLADADVDAFLTALAARLGRQPVAIACNNKGRVCSADDGNLVGALAVDGLQ